MIAELMRTVTRDGFAFLSAYMPDVSTATALHGLSSVVQLDGFSEVQILRPRHLHESPPNTYSGNFGLDVFPFHTDLAHWYLPPRYVALRCVSGSSAVTTNLLCSSSLLQEFGTTSLHRTLLRPRRPMRGLKVLLRLLERGNDGLFRLRWDTLYLAPASEKSTSLCMAIQGYLAAASPTKIALSNAGDTLIIDNWRMFHARSAVPSVFSERVIHRAYLGALL